MSSGLIRKISYGLLNLLLTVSVVPRGFGSRKAVMWFPVLIISTGRETFEKLGLRVTLGAVCLACLFSLQFFILEVFLNAW